MVLFVDGKKETEKTVPGSLRDLDPRYSLILGDEASGGRPWKGSLRDLVVFPRAVSDPRGNGSFQGAGIYPR